MYALHERVLLVSVLTSEEPRVNEEARVDIHELPAGLTRLILQANSWKARPREIRTHDLCLRRQHPPPQGLVKVHLPAARRRQRTLTRGSTKTNPRGWSPVSFGCRECTKRAPATTVPGSPGAPRQAGERDGIRRQSAREGRGPS